MIINNIRNINISKALKILLTCALIVILSSITILLILKYMDEKTTLSIEYDKKKWIELPSFTFCPQEFNQGDQTNMTFDEYMNQSLMVTDLIISSNFSIFAPYRK